jgi:hypothetical protein
VAYERGKGEVIVNIDRFADRLEFRLTLAASENSAEAFVSHAVTAAAFWTVQQNPALIEFAHSNKTTLSPPDEAASLTVQIAWR